MTSPIKLPPPKSPYNRPARELAGYVAADVDDGEEVPTPTGPGFASEAISLLAAFGPVTLYQMAAGLDPYLLAFKRTKYNATPYNYARITADVLEAGATTALLRLYYSLTGAAGTFVSAGLTPIECAINAQGILVGGGFLVAAASDDVYWAVQAEGGDGVESPRLDLVTVQFELAQNIQRPPQTRYFCPTVPSVQPAADVFDGGWVDVFGVNSLEPNGRLYNKRLWLTPTVYLPFDTQANMAANGWTFSTVNGGHGGWASATDGDTPPTPALQRGGVIMLICLNNREQSMTKAITLPPHAKGYVTRGKMMFRGGTWTVVGYPGQCGPGWGPTECGSGSFGSAICNLPILATLTAAGSSKSFAAAVYGMAYDLARPWGTVHATIAPGVDGSQSVTMGLYGGVGYGTTIVGVGSISIAPNDATEDPGALCTAPGDDVELLDFETDYDDKRASGPIKRYVDDPLAAQTIPAWTYQIRLAAGITAAARYAVGHVHVRVYIWRESDESVVALIGDVTSPQLDTTVREFDLAIAGSSVAVLAGDRFVIEISGSIDTPADVSGYFKWTESAGIVLQYNGDDTSFSSGSAPDAGGAASHIVLPGVSYS